jgi:2'-5' RNA ligase
MRTFVAVDIDEPILREVQHIRDRLEKAGADVKWVKNNNTHLTMKFIGEIGPDQVPDVCAALEKAAQGAEPFDIEIRGVGTFSRRRPSVLWVGTEDPAGGLARLHKAVENALQKLGIKKEGRKFSPHLTLGRVKSGKNIRELLEALDAEQPAEMGTSRVESLYLFESKLTPQGPIYNRLAEINLRGT